MPGKILIIDPIVTNRIVTKVKLASACYQVAQASCGVDGLNAARLGEPDLILCSSDLPDMEAADLARALRQNQKTQAIPLIVETLRRDSDFRFSALEAGADDVLMKPYDEKLMLARLRSLLRLRQTADELTLRQGADRALGLAEAREPFTAPARIAFAAPTVEAAVRWRAGLEQHLPGPVIALPLKEAMRRIDSGPAPDVVAVLISPDLADVGLQLIADLRAKPETRDTGILVLIEGNSSQQLAADALDRGAGDVVTERFPAREIALRLGRQIDRKRMLERLRSDMRDGLRAALTDPLTGLHNRRHAMPHMARIADEMRDARRDFAAMVIDVDHFKLINDRFGHAAGDTVLVHLAEVLRGTIGDQTLLARIGGEEFLVVLPETSRAAAHLAAKRICRAVRESGFSVPGRARPLMVTVSIGVALLSDAVAAIAAPGQADPQAALHQIVLDLADKALYGAKAHGRNQVTLSDTRSAA